MDKIWIGKGNPEKVIEEKGVHYFCFPIEVGLGKIKIGKISIPLPVKWPDIEPIKVENFNSQIHVSTRFHYKFLVYFNNPQIRDKRAIADFSLGSHSPFIHSSEGSQVGMRIAIEKFDGIESQWIRFLCATCLAMVNGKLKTKKPNLQDYEIKKGNVPVDVLFEIKSATLLCG